MSLGASAGFALGVSTCLVGLVLMASAAGKAVAPVAELEEVSAIKRHSLGRPPEGSPEKPPHTPSPLRERGSPGRERADTPFDADGLPLLRDPRLRTGAVAAGFVPGVSESIVDAVARGGDATPGRLDRAMSTESSLLLALPPSSSSAPGGAGRARADTTPAATPSLSRAKSTGESS